VARWFNRSNINDIHNNLILFIICLFACLFACLLRRAQIVIFGILFYILEYFRTFSPNLV